MQMSQWRSTGTSVMRGLDELLEELDESQLRITTLSVSTYIQPHQERVQHWDGLLASLVPAVLPKAGTGGHKGLWQGSRVRSAHKHVTNTGQARDKHVTNS